MLVMLLSGGSPALAVTWAAGTPSRADHFFDFERARGYWTTLRTRKALEGAYEACEAGPYGDWVKEYRRGAQVALMTLDQRADKEAEAIKACHDLEMTTVVWIEVATWRARAAVMPDGSRDETDDYCGWAAHHDLFTNSCNGLPSWGPEE